MSLFSAINQKFNNDARKAFFAELSTRLEFMAENLTEETPDSHFEEMLEILTELRSQAMHVRVSKFSTPIKIEFKAGEEVKF